MAWLNELRRILTNQQKLLRGQRTSGVHMGQKVKMSTHWLQSFDPLLKELKSSEVL